MMNSLLKYPVAIAAYFCLALAMPYIAVKAFCQGFIEGLKGLAQ